jgi:hypothetical protein
MNIQYGFAKLRSTIHFNDGQIFANVGDVIMFCKLDEEIIFGILSDNVELNRGTKTFSAEIFKKYFKVINNVYLLCTNGLIDKDLFFVKGLVYHFNGRVFENILPNLTCWQSSSKLLPFDEIWETTNFFLSGNWMSKLDFTVISKREAFKFKESYELKTDSEKFGL